MLSRQAISFMEAASKGKRQPLVVAPRIETVDNICIFRACNVSNARVFVKINSGFRRFDRWGRQRCPCPPYPSPHCRFDTETRFIVEISETAV
jgi:hypothetical protein